ncbi:class I SAM-dependent methyltransferase [Bradyrhizobium sp. HKCCYLS3013]|uniref:class I SAM-dependent methyltransferase n=1 Tax=Bradyrhizobium sp. HKCCYLS3013 TaxID=3420735 RepID=UPI003EBCA95F
MTTAPGSIHAPAVFDLSSLTEADIGAMSYNDLIGLVRETNRFPGGRRSVHLIASRLMLNRQSRVLEIGCATGSTSIELSRLVGCRPTAIDINPRSIAEAQYRAATVGADVAFMVADATEVPLPDASFDAVICGNVTALVADKSAIVAEYRRLLRDGGVLVAAPMYYVRQPPDDLVERVRAAIQVDIPVLYRHDALEFFLTLGFETYDLLDFEFDDVAQQNVDQVCRDVLGRAHLHSLPAGSKRALDRIYSDYMTLFRENMATLGFTVLFLRKTRFIEDSELFTAHPVRRAPP